MEGRDRRGRFAKGGTGRPGNPFLRRIGELRRTVLNFAVEEDMEHAALVLKELAMSGDLAAIKLLFGYLLGPPRETVESDGLDMEEEAKGQETSLSHDPGRVRGGDAPAELLSPPRPVHRPPRRRKNHQPPPARWHWTRERAVDRKQTVEKPPSAKRRNGPPCRAGPIPLADPTLPPVGKRFNRRRVRPQTVENSLGPEWSRRGAPMANRGNGAASRMVRPAE